MELIPGLPNDVVRECLIRVPHSDFSTFFEVCKAWNTEINSKLFHQHRHATGFTQSILVLTQALTVSDSAAVAPTQPKYQSTTARKYQLTVCEPETGLWSRLPPIPGFPDGGLPLFCQCAAVGRYLVVIGGWNPTSWKASNSVFVFDFLSATWKVGAHMPGPARSFFGCTSDSDQMVYVAGGHDDEKNALRSVLVYHVVKDEWLALPDMAKERDECKAVFYDGKVHVIGGYCTEKQGEFEKDVEAFDVATWKWCQVENDFLWTDMGTKNCVTNKKGKLVRCHEGNVAILEGAKWQEVAQLPTDIRVGPFMLTWQDKLLVIGSSKFGGAKIIYMLEFTGDRAYKWTKVETPDGFAGNIQAGCSLQL